MNPQMRTALVRGQVALGVPRLEAEDFARFVAETLHAVQSVRLNEKATVAAVALVALDKRNLGYLDISTEVLETQEFSPIFAENSPLTAPNQRPNNQETLLIPVFQNNPVEPMPA